MIVDVYFRIVGICFRVVFDRIIVVGICVMIVPGIYFMVVVFPRFVRIVEKCFRIVVVRIGFMVVVV
jgi:hypothetical protein